MERGPKAKRDSTTVLPTFRTVNEGVIGIKSAGLVIPLEIKLFDMRDFPEPNSR